MNENHQSRLTKRRLVYYDWATKWLQQKHINKKISTAERVQA